MNELLVLLRHYVRGIWRRRWLALGMAWLLCLAGWAGVAAIPDQYQASARLYVDADAVLTPLLRGVALEDSPSNQLEVLQRTLLSRPNLEKLISKTDLELAIGGPSDLERMEASLATAIQVTPQTRNLFTITYRNASPKLAYEVVQSVLTIFIESKSGNSRNDMENARLFLEQQITQYEQKLRQAEAQRAQFTSKYLDLLPDAGGGASRLEAARTQVANLQEQLKQAQLRLELTRQQLAGTQPTLSAEQEAAAVGGGSELSRAEQKLAELRLRYTEQHPDVIHQRGLVEELRRSGRGAAAASPPAGGTGRSRSVANPIYEKLKLQVFDLETGIVTIKQQIADRTAERDRLDTVARGAPGVLAEYTDLNRDYEVLHKNYQELIQRREAMRLAAAADTDAEKVKLEVVDPPLLPRLPAAPKRMLLLSGVLLAGLAGGAASALLLLQFDTSFHSLDDLRGLDLPVVGGISLIAASVPWRNRLFAMLSFATVLLALCAVYGGLLYRLRHPGAA
jgi:polysaccharide chain length determinant protein (PEP-CTERM system associated)